MVLQFLANNLLMGRNGVILVGLLECFEGLFDLQTSFCPVKCHVMMKNHSKNERNQLDKFIAPSL